MMQSFIASAPHSLGDLLDVSFRFFRLKFGKLITLAAIFVTIRLALTLVANMLDISVLTALINIVDSVVTVFFTLALLVYVLATLAGEEPPIGAAISRGAGFFWSYFGMSLLMGLAVGGSMLPGAIIWGVALASMTRANSGVLGLLALLAGLLLMGVPAVFFLTRWMVTGQALVEEHAGATGSLGRSWELTSGYFWRCVGYFLLVGLLSLVIIYVPAFLMGALLVIFPPEMRATVQMGANIVVALLSALWTPFSIVAVVMMYLDLRVRKEGLDLEMRVQQLEHSAAAPIDPA